MPDITMCEGKDCPDVVRTKCYRYFVTPSEFWQSYFTESPFEMEDGKLTCKMFWGANSEYVFNLLESIVKGEVK